jgi:hypothetical protein
LDDRQSARAAQNESGIRATAAASDSHAVRSSFRSAIERNDAPMAVKTFLMALSGMAAGMGDYFPRILRLVL